MSYKKGQLNNNIVIIIKLLFKGHRSLPLQYDVSTQNCG